MKREEIICCSYDVKQLRKKKSGSCMWNFFVIMKSGFLSLDM